jgi:plastocyanin
VARPVAALAVCACLALAAGCGDQEPGDPVETDRVVMRGNEFHPQDVAVRPGTTITWVNEDRAAHDVVNLEEGEEPRSELFGRGGTYRFAPRGPGTIRYVCTVHPGMDGTVTVTQRPGGGD